MKRFKINDCKSVSISLVQNTKLTKADQDEFVDAKHYISLVGSLMHLTTTRPDLMFAVSLLSRYLHQPGSSHLTAAKRILRYIKGSADLGIKYSKVEYSKLEGFVDSDWGGCVDDMKSTTGLVLI